MAQVQEDVLAQIENTSLDGRTKAAILMISLGPDLSAEVFNHLREEEMEKVTLEIANIDQISPDQREEILEEFQQLLQAQEHISRGGIDYAQDVLERALGPSRASDIVDRLRASMQVRPFDFMRQADPDQLTNFIQNEHPQTIALIMAYLDSEKAAMVLSELAPERQSDVIRRIAIMDRTSPEVLEEVESVLEKKLSTLVTEEYASAGGLEAVVDVLNNVDRGTEKQIMETMDVQDPDLAESIKKRMFVFEDIVLLDDRSLQRVLREVDLQNDLPLALKAASDEVADKIYDNLSNRAVEALKEDLEYLGPVRLRDVEEAQQAIVSAIRRLEEEGEIIISRGGSDEIVV